MIRWSSLCAVGFAGLVRQTGARKPGATPIASSTMWSGQLEPDIRATAVARDGHLHDEQPYHQEHARSIFPPEQVADPAKQAALSSCRRTSPVSRRRPAPCRWSCGGSSAGAVTIARGSSIRDDTKSPQNFQDFTAATRKQMIWNWQGQIADQSRGGAADQSRRVSNATRGLRLARQLPDRSPKTRACTRITNWRLAMSKRPHETRRRSTSTGSIAATTDAAARPGLPGQRTVSIVPAAWRAAESAPALPNDAASTARRELREVPREDHRHHRRPPDVPLDDALQRGRIRRRDLVRQGTPIRPELCPRKIRRDGSGRELVSLRASAGTAASIDPITAYRLGLF